MSKSRDAVIAVTATIFFGVFSRVTVRIPYMVWGYFDESFFISFVWWLLYAGSLYVAIREYMENVDSYFKVILQAGLFGGAAALIKTAADVFTEQIIINMNSGNAVISVFVMELELLIFGSGVMVFLYYFVAKKKIFSWKKSLHVYGGIIAGDLAVYIGMIYYYLLKTDWALERFSGAVQQVGTEQAKLNLTTKFAQESTTVGMLVFTVFFITLWMGLRKNAEDRRG